MADNVTANPGSGGATFATDDIGGIQYPRAKIGFGSDGNYQDVSRDTPLPVSAEDVEYLLRRLVDLLLSPAGFDRSLGRARGTVIVESGTVTTVNTVNTVSTVSNLSAFGGLPADAVARHQNLAAWQLCQRSTIS